MNEKLYIPYLMNYDHIMEMKIWDAAPNQKVINSENVDDLLDIYSKNIRTRYIFSRDFNKYIWNTDTISFGVKDMNLKIIDQFSEYDMFTSFSITDNNILEDKQTEMLSDLISQNSKKL